MQPFQVKLDYRNRSWCTVKFEVGLETPKSVRVIRADHQIAQKLHAASAPGSERAHDLVDLQLLDHGENLDLAQVRDTCVRLFDYRREQAWPPAIAAGPAWDSLYSEAAEGLDVLTSVAEAVAWANTFVQRIAGSG